MSEQTSNPTGVDRAFAWLKERERPVLLAAAGFHLLVLLGMIIGRLLPLWTGTPILVRVMPVDPRDLFRGDYVTLSYEFSRFLPQGIEGLTGDGYASAGKTVYVTMTPEPDGKHWKAEKMSLHQPPSGIFLRGRITGYGQIEYGIESYFVQEHKGLDYERAVRERKLAAELVVAKDGQAVLRELRID